MQGAKQLDAVFGSGAAEVSAEEVHITLPAQTLAIFRVR
jgi:hypothetical protein